jgi:ABC-type glycerol-3-phosphate transport system substrate-binding protein
MQMTSFQIVLLSIFGALAVAGILIFAFLVGSNTGSTIGVVTVWGPFDETAVQTIIRQLSEDDARLRQVTYIRKNADTFEQELTNALASGTGPDLFLLRSDHTVVDALKIATIPYDTLTKEQFEGVFVEAARAFLGQEGILAVPLTVDPFVLYWNRDLLSAAGYANPPVYWDEVFDMARTITDCQRLTAAAANTLVGCDEMRTIQKATIGMGEFDNVDHAKGIIALLILQAGGPLTQRDSAGELVPSLRTRQGDVANPAESALTFYTTFANPANNAYSWNKTFQGSRSTFASGDLALYVGLASEQALIRRLNPNLNFAISPIPQLRSLDTSTNSGYAYGFAVPRASKNPSGALTAAYLLASAPASKAFATVFGHASARRDVVGVATQGSGDLVDRQALIMRTWEDPHPVETTRIFRDMINSITSGSAKVTEALQRAEQAMQQIPSQ